MNSDDKMQQTMTIFSLSTYCMLLLVVSCFLKQINFIDFVFSKLLDTVYLRLVPFYASNATLVRDQL